MIDKTSMSDVPQIIVGINKADVLLGRGKRVHLWQGNVTFRSLCEASANSYLSTNDVLEKDTIVQEIILKIRTKGGRFLREKEIPALDGTHKAWVTVPANVIRTKIKQACRDSARIRIGGKRIRPNGLKCGPESERLHPKEVQHSLCEIKASEFSCSHASCEKSRSDNHPQAQVSTSRPNEPNDRELWGALLSMCRSIQADSTEPEVLLPREQLPLPPEDDAIEEFSSDRSIGGVVAPMGGSYFSTAIVPPVLRVNNFIPVATSYVADDRYLSTLLEMNQFALCQSSRGVVNPFFPRYIAQQYQGPPLAVPNLNLLPESADHSSSRTRCEKMM